ncbi:MAG TPA: phenylalanine--tRNA ligase subunit alpha [Legionellales bacterium]|nr:phenylalanine--tRNA ligase subunit alpha [Legionellales bacterium]
MVQSIEELQDLACQEIDAATHPRDIEQIRVNYLGKKGRLTEFMKTLSDLPPSEKPKLGQMVNVAKTIIQERLESRLVIVQEQLLSEQIAAQTLDVTLAGRESSKGHLHPVTQTKNRLCEFFTKLGFDLTTGPEIETDFNNFTALNIPEHHPARAMHDTFYVAPGHLLRTHTSPVQIRALKKGLPVRVIAPGRVYRHDSDVTHTPMFHQLEGLMIDKTTHLAHLKYILQVAFSNFFEKDIHFRFRPSYFPFTEPSAEMDMTCHQCAGKGCRLCKHTGWIEIGGCGMVHPNVLDAVGVDSKEYQGWAFGIGLDRLAMLNFGIDDLRMMFENDMMFLKQF